MATQYPNQSQPAAPSAITPQLIRGYTYINRRRRKNRVAGYPASRPSNPPEPEEV